MKIPKQLIDSLDQNKVQYEILHHAEAVTAQRIAQAQHVKGRHQAKVVMLKSDDQHLMVVLPQITTSIWRKSRKRSENLSLLEWKTTSNHCSQTP